MSLTREELIEAIRQMEDGVRADEGEPLKGDTAEMAEKRQRDLQMLEAAIATEGRNLAAAADRLDRELKEARSERDAARLELRALEWLCEWCAGDEGIIVRDGEHVVVKLLAGPRDFARYEERSRGRTYASAARALGWEG